jgi:integral membrane protein
MSKHAWESTPQVGEYLTDNDPRVRLIRKIKITKFMAALETISYCGLLIPMYRKHILDVTVNSNEALISIIGYFHGIIAAAFAVMVFDIRRPMKWGWGFFVLVLLGPIGAIIGYERLRRQPVPSQVNAKDMYF